MIVPAGRSRSRRLRAERGEQVQVVGEVEEPAISHDIATERDNEGIAAEGVDIGRDRLKPVDETVLARKPLPPRHLRRRLARAGDCRHGLV